jgi:ubiquinone/menaquinone biosynthesis C-methylase UbiE
MRYPKTIDVLAATLDLDGVRVADIGCGDGTLARLIAGYGASVTGIDPNPSQIAKARAQAPVKDETFVEGVAEHLPMDDASVRLVVFSNSLHHVPVESQPAALAEASRILEPGGALFISEPLAEGAQFELGRLIHNEASVRAKALEAIRTAGRWGLDGEHESVHIQAYHFPDFATFVTRQIAVEPERGPIIAENAAAIEAAFHRLGVPTAEGWRFEQPIRINLLRKRA